MPSAEDTPPGRSVRRPIWLPAPRPRGAAASTFTRRSRPAAAVPRRADGRDGSAPGPGVRRTDAERYRALAEDGPVVFSVLEVDPGPEPKYRLRYISPADPGHPGYPAGRFYADVWNWLEFVHPDDLSIAEEHQPATGRRASLGCRLPDDRGRRPHRVDASRRANRGARRSGDPRRLQGIMMDVTDAQGRRTRAREEAPAPILVEQTARHRMDVRRRGPDRLATDLHRATGGTARSGTRRPSCMAEPRFFDRLVHPDDRERDPRVGCAMHPRRRAVAR